MAKQKLQFEQYEYHERFYECQQCSEPITNPLCHDCLGNHIIKWLSFYPSAKKKLLPKIKKYIREVNNTALGAVNCVACKNKKAALCPYCFTEEIFNMLKREKTNKMIIMDFLCIFNFDLKHGGYIAEAAKEGLY